MTLKFKINKYTIPKFFIIFQFLYVCVVRLLIEFGIPDTATLLCDVVNIILLLYLSKYFGLMIKSLRYDKYFWMTYTAFFVLGTISSLVNGFNIYLWIWSMRNFGRFLIYYLACVTFIESNDLVKIKKIIYCLSHINVFLTLYQFFVLDKNGDYIGGLFGTQGGIANTWMNVFLAISVIVAISEWLCEKQGIRKIFIVIIEGLICAVLSELKLYYIELLVFLIISFLIARKNKKQMVRFISITAFGVVAVAVSIPILYKLFPMFKNFFSADVILKTMLDSYTGNNDLGRMTAIVDISKNIFNSSIDVIFGIGLGNAEYSSGQALFQSEFYIKYLYTRYFWFTDAVVMIQNGIVGVILYIMSFGTLMRKALKTFQNRGKKNEYNMITVLGGICGCMLFVYNISLNTEAAYMFFLVLSMSSIYTKSEKR